MNIDWGNAPVCEDYPKNDVVWVVDIEDPASSGWHVYLPPSISSGGRYKEVDSYAYWRIEGTDKDDLHFKVYRRPEEGSLESLIDKLKAVEAKLENLHQRTLAERDYRHTVEQAMCTEISGYKLGDRVLVKHGIGIPTELYIINTMYLKLKDEEYTVELYGNREDDNSMTRLRGEITKEEKHEN